MTKHSMDETFLFSRRPKKVIIDQGWAPRSFPFGTFPSFLFLKGTFRSFPFFFRVFGDLQYETQKNIPFFSVLF